MQSSGRFQEVRKLQFEFQGQTALLKSINHTLSWYYDPHGVFLFTRKAKLVADRGTWQQTK